MPKSDLGDVCGRYLSPRLSKQTESSISLDQQSINLFLHHDDTSSDHERSTIVSQQYITKTKQSQSVDKSSQFITNLTLENIDMPANNDVLLTTFNNNTATNGTNGTNGNHQYRTSFTSCSNENGNGNHSLSSPTSSSSSSPSNDSSSLMMNWELLKDRGSGLVNLGNTCFINASLQCLANTPPLVQWILCNSHYQCCRVKLEKQFCLFCEAERIVKMMHSKTGNSSFSSSVTAANPNNIVRRIKEISTTFKSGRQEDASEFMICLIDKIVDACLRSSQPPERLRPSSGTSYEQLCHSQTILHDLFGLVLRSRVVCLRCRHTSDTFEVQYTWIVGVRNHSDVRQSLKQFVCRETLSGENLYRCIKCKQLVPAMKRYTLHKASKILLINLKRFEFGKNSHKLSHPVRYPEFLNVSEYMSDDKADDQSLNYRLYAVLVHVGSSMHSGHYFSYVRAPNNRWYKADDTTMTQCDVTQVLAQHGAYILCYIKETPGSSPTSTTSASTTLSPTSTMPSSSKLVYQNGKSTSSDHQSSTTPTTHVNMFTPRQVPIQNLSKQANGQNGCNKLISISLTKPAIVQTSNNDSSNGNGVLPTVKREPIVMRIPKLSSLSSKPVLHETKTIFNSNSSTTPSLSTKIIHRTPVAANVSSTTKNSNFIISSATSLSSIQSTSSPLKLIIKTSGPTSTLNGLASISSSYNHNDEDDDDSDDNDNSSHSTEPAKKKARIDDSTTVSPNDSFSPPIPVPPHLAPNIISTPSNHSVSAPVSLISPVEHSSQKQSQMNSTSENQPMTSNSSSSSSSSTTKHKKKKKKKKSHHHHHHHHRHHKSHRRHHHKRSRHDSSRSRSRSRSYSRSVRSRSVSLSPSSPSHSNGPSFQSDDYHHRHRKTRKHRRHKRSTSSTSSSSLSSSASPPSRDHS